MKQINTNHDCDLAVTEIFPFQLHFIPSMLPHVHQFKGQYVLLIILLIMIYFYLNNTIILKSLDNVLTRFEL